MTMNFPYLLSPGFLVMHLLIRFLCFQFVLICLLLNKICNVIEKKATDLVLPPNDTKH